jgi:hypothetical protein
MSENNLNESNLAGDEVNSHALNTTESAIQKTQDIVNSLENEPAKNPSEADK